MDQLSRRLHHQEPLAVRPGAFILSRFSLISGIGEFQGRMQLAVTISNTEGRILTYAKGIVGCGHITNKRVSRKHHTPSMTYIVTNRQAIDVLRQITPYLRSYKADRARCVLDHYVRLTPRNGKYSPEVQVERAAFIDRFFRLNPTARKPHRKEPARDR